ncbi:MAG: PAS domain S-box protein [Methanomicrobiales archaeon]|nr:PAS domain S-box protein [Methanomicrobiales archaeon]
MITILYVDDEPALLELGKIFLEQDGEFVVSTCTSAPEALSLLNTTRYDAIISDYQMPEMDGISFIRALRARGDTTPFIIFTGRGREEVVIQALNEGADFYLQKGGDSNAQFAELSHKIRHAVSRKLAVRSLQKSEQDYRHLITHANEAIYVVQDDMLKMVNPALEEMTGYTHDELLNLPFTTFIHPDDRDFVADRYRRRVQGETLPNRYNFRLYRKDRTARWVELSVVVISWDERPAVLVFLTDIHERKLTEDALIEREERYRQFFRTTLDCVFITTPEGAWIDFNDALVAMFGYSSREEIRQVPVASIYARPDEREGFLDEVVRAGYVRERVLLFRKKDGTVFDALITIVPLKNPDGSIKAFIGTFRDVTEKKRIEEALRTSEERYRIFFKTIRDSVFITTPAGDWIDFNDALVETLGFSSREEVWKAPVSSVYANPAERDAFLRRVSVEGYVREYPLLFRKQDGTVFDALITIVPIKNEDGTVRAFSGTVRDISAQKRVERALIEREKQYRTIFETFEDLYYQTDAEGRITILSPSLNRLTGWTAEELMGKPATALYVDPGKREVLLGELNRNGSVRDYELLLRKRDGTHTPASLSATVLYDDDNKPAGVAGILRDITGRKQAEESLRESERKFRSLVEYSLEPILILDYNFCILFLNSAAARMIEPGDPAQVIGRNVLQFIAPQSRDDALRDFAEVRGGRDAFLTRYFITPSRDRTLYVECIGKIITFEERPAVLISLRDISDKQQAENALRESEEKFRTLVEFSLETVLVLDLEGKILFANTAAARTLEADEQESLIGRNVFEFIAPESQQDVIHDFSEVARGHDSFIAHYQVISAKGNRIQIESIGKIITYEGRTADLVSIRDVTEQKRAEHELRQSEETHRILLDQSTDPIFAFYPDGTYRYVNRAFADGVGKTVDEITGRKIWDVFEKEEADKRFAALHSVFSTGEGKEIEVRVPRPEGDRYYVTTIVPIRDGAGTVVSAICSSKDITARKRVEDALRESESRFRSLAESLQDVVIRVDRTYRHLYTNPAIEQQTGFTPEQLLKKSLREVGFPADLSSRIEAMIDEVFSFGKRVRTELLLPNSRWIDVIAVPEYDLSSEIVCVIITGRDITERKRTEHLLADRLLFQQVLIDTIPYPIFIKDAGARFVGCNTAYERVFGTTREYMIGKTVLDLEYLPLVERERFQAEDMQVIREAGRKSYELPIDYADGQTHMTLYSVDGFLLSDGKPGGLIGMLVDISDRTRMETALKLANQKLSLLSGITRHDINNQISILTGYLSLLVAKKTPAPPEEYLQKIATSVQRISAMIQFTKDYEEIGISLPAWQDLRALVDTATRQVSTGSIMVKNEIPPGLSLFTDPLISRVFFNLVDNAVRYGGRITTIRFFVKDTGSAQLIVCEDDGEGISAREKERIFDRGYGKNTGLGLSLSREILAITGITIRENGTPGSGARFEITVPRDAIRESSGPQPAHRTPPPANGP